MLHHCEAYSATETSFYKMALPVHLAIPSRGPGGDEKQPERPWPSELPANAEKSCFLVYIVTGSLFSCGLGLPRGPEDQ